MQLKKKNKNVKSKKQADSRNSGIVSVSPDAFGPVVPNVIGGPQYLGEQNSHRRNSGNGSGKKINERVRERVKEYYFFTALDFHEHL
jgi:hypothetical protein